MFDENQIVTVKWNAKTKAHYVSKGYVFTKMTDDFNVLAKDLTDGSHVVVHVVCDYCGQTFEAPYVNYLMRHDEFGDSCKCCKNKKQQDVMVAKYGVSNPSMIKEFQEKKVQTFLDKYGVDNPSKSQDVKNKKIVTSLEHYGTEHPLQSNKIKEKSQNTCLMKYGVAYTTQTDNMKLKSKETCLNKYGVDNASKSDVVKKKIKNSFIEKYGVENIMYLDEYKEKIVQSFKQHGNTPTSNMQIKVSNILKEIFGQESIDDDVVVGYYICDMILNYCDCLIDVEYDGWYWHKDSAQRDAIRNKYIANKGYKILRIMSKESLPTKEQIIEAIDYLFKDNHKIAYIKLDI